MIAPMAELIGMRRGGERWERMAHQISSTVERFFAWGATWAAFGLVAIWGLYPRLWGYLTSLFLVQTIIIAGGLWFVMTVSAYAYYLTWEKLRSHRLWHNAIGWIFVLSTMIFINTIISYDSYQLTPSGGSSDLAQAAVNPSYIGEFPHRHIGNISYGGVILAAYAAGWLLLFRGGREMTQVDREYRDWLADVALLIGVAFLSLQPLAGWFYVSQIRGASFRAFYRMMIGEQSWMFLLLIGLLGILFFLSNLYLYIGIRRGDPSNTVLVWMRSSLLALALLVGLGVIPYNLPLGRMIPWKYISLAGFSIVTITNLILYLRARSHFVWGRYNARIYIVMAILGAIVVPIFVLMGIVRESARNDWLIWHQMPSDQAQEILRP